jgi:cyclin B
VCSSFKKENSIPSLPQRNSKRKLNYEERSDGDIRETEGEKIRPSKSLKKHEVVLEVFDDEEDENDNEKDIYLYCRAQEKKVNIPCNFLSSQPEINDRLRKIMIDWVIKLHYALRLSPVTLYLSVNILDRYSCVSLIKKDIYQLVAISAVLAASKYEEVQPPQIDDLMAVTRNMFSRSQIIKMEYILLVSLSFNLSVPSPLVFLEYYLQLMDVDEIHRILSHYILESTLMDTTFYSLLPSQIAAGTVYLSNFIQIENPWPSSLIELTGYSRDDVRSWALMIRNHLSRLRTSTSLKGIIKKYLSEEFFQVSSLSLPKF